MFAPKEDWDSPLLAYTSAKVYYRASKEEEKAFRAVLENEIGYVEEITAVMRGRKGEEKKLAHTEQKISSSVPHKQNSRGTGKGEEK